MEDSKELATLTDKQFDASYRQCSAKSKQSGQRCGRRAMIGKSVCHMHGGKSLSGPDSPTWKEGTRSKITKSLPARLVESFDASEGDGGSLSHQIEIDLLFSLMTDAAARLDTGESGELWDSLKETWSEVERCRLLVEESRSDGDYAQRRAAEIELAEALDAAKLLIEAGVSDYAARKELAGLAGQRMKHINSQQNLIVKARKYLAEDEAKTLLQMVAVAVTSEVSDKDTLARIYTKLHALMSTRQMQEG